MADGLQVFIMGPPRSGTSILRSAIGRVLGLPGTGESHVVPIFQRIVDQFNSYPSAKKPNTLAARIDGQGFRDYIINYIREFYKSTYPEGSWTDETPGQAAILSAPLVLDAFPAARLILTQCSGIGLVMSYQSKFKLPFDQACLTWVLCMGALCKVQGKLRNAIAIDQFDIANAPHEVGSQLGRHLGCPDRADALGQSFSGHRIDQLSTHDWRNRLTLADVDWAPEEKRKFVDKCGPTMEKLGYPL